MRILVYFLDYFLLYFANCVPNMNMAKWYSIAELKITRIFFFYVLMFFALLCHFWNVFNLIISFTFLILLMW